MAQFGLARAEGMVVEGDSSALYCIPSAWSLLPDYVARLPRALRWNGVNTSTHVMLSVAQGITVTETENVIAEPLLNSSASAYAKADIKTTLPPWSGRKGMQMAPLRWLSGHGTRIGAEVLWIGCPNMDNEQLYQSMPGNLTFLQGCAASLVGQDVIRHQGAGSRAHHGGRLYRRSTGHGFVFVLPGSSAHCQVLWRCCCAAAGKGTAMKTKQRTLAGLLAAGACAGRAAVVCQPQQCRRRRRFQRRRRGAASCSLPLRQAM